MKVIAQDGADVLIQSRAHWYSIRKNLWVVTIPIAKARPVIKIKGGAK